MGKGLCHLNGGFKGSFLSLFLRQGMPTGGVRNQYTVAGWLYNTIGNFLFFFENTVVEEFLKIGGSIGGLADVPDINETTPASINQADFFMAGFSIAVCAEIIGLWKINTARSTKESTEPAARHIRLAAADEGQQKNQRPSPKGPMEFKSGDFHKLMFSSKRFYHTLTEIKNQIGFFQ
jgi:hypothetical protein